MGIRIGAVAISQPTVFAPLAGISDLPMRLMAKAAGCGLVYSEMVSANALVQGPAKTMELLRSIPAEKPLAIQIFGSDPAIMAEAARRVVKIGADIVDINFGCSVKKILKSGAGAALMKEPHKAAALLRAVRAAIDVPLTIKLRTGWDTSGEQALLLARIAQDCGVDAIAIHPRTARQGFSGRSDWNLITRLKAQSTIPIIGNGDVVTAGDALAMFAQTGCDAVMVGRAAIGNPFIFAQIGDLLAGRSARSIAAAERIALMSGYAAEAIDHLGETRACRILRSRLAWFVKGLPHAGHFRHAIRRLSTRQEAESLIAAFGAQTIGEP
jgi:tRNA-dihydrouridine synthase B